MKKALASSFPLTPRIVSLDAYPEQAAPRISRTGAPDRHAYLEGRLAISTTGKIDMIEMAEITYVKAESNYVRIWVKEK